MLHQKHIVIFVPATPDFDNLIEIMGKFLHPDFTVRVTAAVGKLKEDYMAAAVEYAELKLEQLSPVVCALEPLLEEYRDACDSRHNTSNFGRSLVLKKLYTKLNELYGKTPEVPAGWPRDDPL